MECLYFAKIRGRGRRRGPAEGEVSMKGTCEQKKMTLKTQPTVKKALEEESIGEKPTLTTLSSSESRTVK